MTNVWALGGLAIAAPANSLPAYWGALGAGADGLCITLNMTKDGTLVCWPHSTENISFNDLSKVDIGKDFVSTEIDKDGKIITQGTENPWAEVPPPARPNALNVINLEKMLLHFSRRTKFLFHVKTSSQSKDILRTLVTTLKKFGIRDRTIIASDNEGLKTIENNSVSMCLVDDATQTVSEITSQIDSLPDAILLTTAARLDQFPDGEFGKILLPSKNYVAPTREDLNQINERSDVIGVATLAADKTRDILSDKGMVHRENFAGPQLNTSIWALGTSRDNKDTQYKLSGGLIISMKGENYSGAAAFSEFSTFGDFDARVDYEVTNPTQGTTFELAVVNIEAGYHRPNLTFDVHGAPPYASSERDEADGFRMGWNNGPALTRWVDRKSQSSNLYNNYSRDVGDASPHRSTGTLRLTRCGPYFNSYFKDVGNQGWVLSGTATVPTLAPSVFFRLGAKHWPKGGGAAPDNTVTFSAFELFQWS